MEVQAKAQAQAQGQSISSDVDRDGLIVDEENNGNNEVCENGGGHVKEIPPNGALKTGEKEEAEEKQQQQSESVSVASVPLFQLKKPVLDFLLFSAPNNKKGMNSFCFSGATSMPQPLSLSTIDPPTSSSSPSQINPHPACPTSNNTEAPLSSAPIRPAQQHENLTKFQKYGKELVEYLQSPESKDYVRFCQRDAVLAVMKLLENDKQEPGYNGVHNPVLIKAPAGSGKSGIIALLPYALEAKKVLVLTPSSMLSNQLEAEIGNSITRDDAFLQTINFCGKGIIEKEAILEKVTTITKNYNPDAVTSNFTIINVQKFGSGSKTCLNTASKFWDPSVIRIVTAAFELHDLLVVDEAHHFPAETWQIVTDLFLSSRASATSRKVIVLLTATATRGDGSPILTNQQSRIAYSIGLEELEGITIRKVEFIENKIHKSEPLDETVYSDICKILSETKAKGGSFNPQAMVMVLTTNDATEMAKKFNSFSHDDKFAVAIIGNSQSESNTKLFSDGKYRVAIICDMLKEGYSNNKVTLCVILRKISSWVLFEQFIGRCSRLRITKDGVPDETRGIVLSYSQFQQKKMWDARNKLAGDDKDGKVRMMEGKVEIQESVPKRRKRTVQQCSPSEPQIENQQPEPSTSKMTPFLQLYNEQVETVTKRKKKNGEQSKSNPTTMIKTIKDTDKGEEEEKRITDEREELGLQPLDKKNRKMKTKSNRKKTKVEPDSDEYEVERILDKRMLTRGVEYLVRWTGFDQSNDTWEPSEGLRNCKGLINQFNKELRAKNKKK